MEFFIWNLVDKKQIVKNRLLDRINKNFLIFCISNYPDKD